VEAAGFVWRGNATAKSSHDLLHKKIKDDDLPDAFTCVEIKISRRVRAESSRRPTRHRRDACSMAWQCRFLTARPSQDGRAIAEK